MPRPSELLSRMIKELSTGVGKSAVLEFGRWLDNINGQADTATREVGGGATPIDAPYVTTAPVTGLPSERVIAATAPITAVDGGPNGYLTVAISPATPSAAGSMSAADKTKLDSAVILVAAPASAGATGAIGEIAVDAGYVYLCVATDTWLRAAISTWP